MRAVSGRCRWGVIPGRVTHERGEANEEADSSNCGSWSSIGGMRNSDASPDCDPDSSRCCTYSYHRATYSNTYPCANREVNNCNHPNRDSSYQYRDCYSCSRIY